MNEELRIVIRAITEDAQKNLAQVREELDDIGDAGNEAGDSMKGSMSTMGKAALAAVAAVAALTAAVVALGKKSLEFQKTQAQLVAGFQAAGMSAEQASKTYQELFRFLGEADTATEAANLLAKLTTDTESLTEWTQILQGVYAAFPDSIPVEALAEAANETVKTGVVTGNLADALNWMGVSEDEVNAKLATTTSLEEREVMLRGLLNSLYGTSAQLYERNNQALIRYNESQANLDMALAEATKYVVPLLTNLNNLAATLLTYLKPALETISRVLIVFCQWVIAAIQYVGAFFGIFSESATATDEVASSMDQIQTNTSNIISGAQDYTGALEDATEQAKELKKQTMGFDELNVVSKPVETPSGGGAGGSGGGAGGGLGVAIPNIGSLDLSLPSLSNFEAELEETKEKITAILTLVGLVAAGWATWKITNFIQELIAARKLIAIAGQEGALTYQKIAGKKAQDAMDGMANKLKSIAGTILIVAGAFATAYGYSDAWANGVDWGNLAITLAGMGAIVGGLALQFGALAASIAVVVAGVALIVLGVVDFIKNGPTLENTILIIGGAIAIAVGLATAGLSVLISAIIAAVAAVGAFVAAILLEEPAIKSVTEAQEELTAAKEKAAEAENAYINAIDNSEAALERLRAAEEAAGMSGADLYAQVQSGALDYANMTAEQRELYKAYLNNEQKQKDLQAATSELTAAKKAEQLASFENQLALAKESGSYDEFKKSIVDAFEKGELSAEEARDLISKSMSEMSDDAQQTFMEDLPDSIRDGLDPHQYESTGTKIKKWFSNLWEGTKNVFSSVGSWFSSVFTAAWNGIKNAFSAVGSFFANIWNTIKNTFSNVGATIGNAITNTVKSAINGVLRAAIGIINGFISAINFAIDVINAIPGVNISKINKLDVPQLARGGVVDKATLAMFGEDGKEAVIPLENNTEWMDILADRIASRNSAPSKIVLKVGERELGLATIGAINHITEQTGELPLVLV